jgi:tRNA A37 methylthiotransferase MiaB
MSGQLDKETKHKRLMQLSSLESNIRRELFENEIKERPVTEVLFETYEEGFVKGHTDSFIEVSVRHDTPIRSEVRSVRLTHTDGGAIFGELL